MPYYDEKDKSFYQRLISFLSVIGKIWQKYWLKSVFWEQLNQRITQLIWKFASKSGINVNSRLIKQIR